MSPWRNAFFAKLQCSCKAAIPNRLVRILPKVARRDRGLMSRSEHSVILEISQAFLHDRIPEYIRDAGSYILSDSGVQKIHIQEGETWEVTGNIQGDDFQVYTPQLTFSIFDHSVKSLCNCSDAFTGICSHVAALTMHLVDELRKEVGMVFQRPNPFPKSIFDNVAYGLKVNGIRDKAFITHRVEEALKGAALWEEVKDKLNASAFALSGGQQQRLCIARAMAVSPTVLLMDEPASALDPISTAKVEELICELRKEVTIVIVTHNMQQASRVSDKTAFFYMGEMVEYDDTKVIFTNPHKEATQNYITGRFG